jgi:antitoxin component of MazEF toxin-antitoxin module
METTVNRWGNVLGIRIPKVLASALRLHDKTKIKIVAEHDRLIITRVREPKPHKTLAEYLEEFGWDGNLIEPEVIDWGKPVGEEVDW